MNKRAYHHVITPDGQTLDQCIVEFSSQGRAVRWYTFASEEPFVEWHGGTLDLREHY